jgi:hypothetical protein
MESSFLDPPSARSESDSSDSDSAIDTGLIEDSWEIKYTDLTFDAIIGTGSFGQGLILLYTPIVL